jgi:glycosyltransferase involved in cell wall biosynthesis
MFAIEVALGVAQRIGRRTSLAILGAGPLEPQVRQRAAELAEHIEVHVVGNVRQAEVPAWFASARVFLFPTSWDPWGVVANEACLAGVPTIVSPRAGAAGELIIDEVNGYIRPLQVSDWVDAATRLIGDDARRALFSQCARERVAPYNAQSAAAGIAEAIRMAAAHGDPQTITGT